MRKKDEIRLTATCLHAAAPDEIVFVLLGRDPAAPIAIRQWAHSRIALGKHPDDPHIVDARALADTMDAERDHLRARLKETRDEVTATMVASHKFDAGASAEGRWGVTCECGWSYCQIGEVLDGDASERDAQNKAISHVEEMIAIAMSASIPIGDRGRRQAAVAAWARRCFGEEQATSLPQRAVRLLEEAIEAYQAAGGSREMATELVDFVFKRPPGTLAQELGGVSVCLLVMADAMGRTADSIEIDEVERVMAKPIEHFTARNQAKNDAGFLACEGEAGTTTDRPYLAAYSEAGTSQKDKR